MKAYRLPVVILLMAVWLLFIIGCEDDVPTPLYYQEHVKTTIPKITEIEPAQEAGAGVNYITIMGEDFSEASGKNFVYFDGFPAEIVDQSASSITVRRPNRSGDSTYVKVVSYGALEVTQYGPYKITPVYSAFGGFIDGLELSAVAVDNEENIYVIQRSPRTVHKIRSDGEKSVIGEAERTVTDAKIGPEGHLIILMNNKTINQMDVVSGEQSEWTSVSKSVRYGDFDSHGNFYAGGRRSDLFVIAPDLSSKTIGVYSSDEIFCVRVYDNYVYLLVSLRSPDENNPELAIWKHAILDAEGNLGDRELVLNWAETGDYAASVVTTFTFSGDGVMYIGTDNVNPIMIVSSVDQDILYKDILPTSAVKLVWGSGNYVYMIKGVDWDLVRLDMGAPGAPYYGRP